MSEPLSRAALEDVRRSYHEAWDANEIARGTLGTAEAVIDTALNYLDRVAELEKDNEALQERSRSDVRARTLALERADREQVKEALRWGRTEAAFIGNRQQVDKFSAALALLGSHEGRPACMAAQEVVTAARLYVRASMDQRPKNAGFATAAGSPEDNLIQAIIAYDALARGGGQQETG